MEDDPNWEWIRVDGGTFDMGGGVLVAPLDYRDGQFVGNGPIHVVTVPSFDMTKTEVTVNQYRACVEAGVCPRPEDNPTLPARCGPTGEVNTWLLPSLDHHPLNCATNSEAVAFCTWVAGRLPTEAEWEFAATEGGTTGPYPWGDAEPTCSLANIRLRPPDCVESATTECPCGGSTEEVCGGDISSRGLCDLAGNVEERTADDLHGNYDGAPTDGSAWTESPPRDLRICRGGSAWTPTTEGLLATDRKPCATFDHSEYIGFRCARNAAY